jgi:hypothetical protein
LRKKIKIMVPYTSPHHKVETYRTSSKMSQLKDSKREMDRQKLRNFYYKRNDARIVAVDPS